MDLRRQVGVLRSWAKVIIVGTLIAALVAFALTSIMPKVYQGDARILVGQTLQSSNPDVNAFDSAHNLALTYTDIAAGRTVLDRVITRLGPEAAGESADTIAKRIIVKADPTLPVITVTAYAGTDKGAANLANAMVAELLATAPTVSSGDQDQFQFIQDDLKAMQAEIEATRAEIASLAGLSVRTAPQDARLAALNDRLVTLRTNYATLLQTTERANANQLSVIDSATVPGGPSSPSLFLNVALGTLLGLLVLVAIAFIWETLDDRVKTSEDVERVTGLVTIGQIMRMPGEKDRKPFYRLATLLYPRSPAAEAFRTLRTNLEFASVDETFRTIVVTSSVPREGKTVVASNLAIALAQAGRRVILVDADLRRPNIHEMFGLRNDRGLTDMVRSDDIRLEQVIHQTEVPGLTVLTSGTPPANPAELLGSQRMQKTLERLHEATEMVVIDTAPVGAVTDAAVLAAEAEATIFVIHGRRTSERAARRGREALEKVRAHVVGVVLNDLPVRSGDATTYYGSDAMEEIPAAVSLPSPATRSSRGGS